MSVSALVAQHGYAIVFLGAMAEGESVLLAAGFAAHRGMLRLHEVMALAFVGSALSDQLYFYLGRRHGTWLLARFPSLRSGVRRVEPMLARHPNAVILSLRFLYGLRTVGPVALGVLGVSRWRFTLLNLVSAALWATLIALAGYQFGSALQWLMPELHEVEEAVLLAVLAAALTWTLWRRRRAAADSAQ